jgi:hypothetical protein
MMNSNNLNNSNNNNNNNTLIIKPFTPLLKSANNMWNNMKSKEMALKSSKEKKEIFQ